MALIFGGGAGIAEDVGFQDGITRDAVAVIMSEDATNLLAWTLQIWCKIGEGRYHVGTVVTTPANVKNAAAPTQPTSRVVACARVPGANTWWVSAFCPGQQVAELMLAGTDIGGGSFGLTLVSP